MKKVFVLLCAFSLFLSLSCSKKSETNKTSEDKGINVEETNKIDDENNSDMSDYSDDNNLDNSGFEGFIFDDEQNDVEEPAIKKESKVSFDNENQEEESDLEQEPEPEPVIERPKDLVPPGPVTNLKGYYNGAKNQVVISWTEPADSDFSHVEIISNGRREGKSKKGNATFGVKAEKLGNYDISVVSYDYSGNAGPSLNCSVEAKFFDSASMPLTGTAGKGRPVRAVVKGVNFSVEGVTPEDFTVTCDEDSAVSKKANVKIIDDNTVYVDVSIPRKAGDYNVNIICGNNKVTGKLKVISVQPVGTVEKASDGTPVAILAGYNSLGLPFGVALDEQKGLKWATSFGYSEKFEEIMCIVPQEQLGAGSAVNASITGDLDGEDNWAAIIAEDKKAANSSYAKDNYPVFYYAEIYGKSMPAGYKDGWFIPSLYELCQIYQNKAKLNEVMTLIGTGKPISGEFYWSSSQCDEEDDKACAVRFDTGSIFKYKRKSDSVYGRCVRMMY